MTDIVQFIALMLVTVAMVPAVAHALELPGKRRLAKDEYFAIQPIYYPGFTWAGMSEPLAIVAPAVLLFLTPFGSHDFWLSLAALVGTVCMHAVYWLFTHPVNNFWLHEEKLSDLGSGFFSLGKGGSDKGEEPRPLDWRRLRDRWEHSHLARAVFATVSFLAMVLALSPWTIE